ncbi:hypothetical protein BJ322DRAFT_1114336 [Thelephora terrestris]|uniref:Uncharacterized protein n=1 Tax=Thelephora terrestris TaxID=56493 RepID=A0A9P6L1I8_9AGAM|nr:hypothetical protein BJ322DRAFT_1114336 [Thelephora terrestris]
MLRSHAVLADDLQRLTRQLMTPLGPTAEPFFICLEDGDFPIIGPEVILKALSARQRGSTQFLQAQQPTTGGGPSQTTPMAIPVNRSSSHSKKRPLEQTNSVNHLGLHNTRIPPAPLKRRSSHVARRYERETTIAGLKETISALEFSRTERFLLADAKMVPYDILDLGLEALQTFIDASPSTSLVGTLRSKAFSFWLQEWRRSYPSKPIVLSTRDEDSLSWYNTRYPLLPASSTFTPANTPTKQLNQFISSKSQTRSSFRTSITVLRVGTGILYLLFADHTTVMSNWPVLLSTNNGTIAVTNLSTGMLIEDNIVAPIIFDGTGSWISGGSCGAVRVICPFPAMALKHWSWKIVQALAYTSKSNGRPLLAAGTSELGSQTVIAVWRESGQGCSQSVASDSKACDPSLAEAHIAEKPQGPTLPSLAFLFTFSVVFLCFIWFATIVSH